MRRLAVLTLAVAVSALACDEVPTTPEVTAEAEGDATPTVERYGPGAAASSMMHSNAPFTTWKQGFNHDLEPWNRFTSSTAWCGSAERVDGRDGAAPSPSAGRGYATLEHGECIPLFSPATSAPASGPVPNLMSTAWPTGGFVHQVDVYLDPGYPSGTAAGPASPTFGPSGVTFANTGDVVFVFAASICLLNADGSCPIPDGLRYFAVPVTKDGGALEVAGEDVTDPGWYTFRYRFGNDGGDLSVEFQLIRNGRPMASTAVTQTYLSPGSTSRFDATEVGSGYLWFASIADGLELPIDEHTLRRGR